MKYLNLKFLFLFFALAVALPPAWALEVTDVLTVQATGIDLLSSSYQDFSGLKSNTDAVYAGKIARGQSSANPSIQIRSSNSDAGIITTTSGGKAKSITITFNSSQTETKTVKVYGKNSAYSSAGDLFGASTRGVEIGSVSSYSNNGSTVTLTGEYEYIGIRSNSGAIYIDKIEIVWDTPQVLDYAATVTPTGAISFGKAAPNTSATQNVTVKNTGANAITPTVSGLATPFSTNYVPTSIATGETITIPVVFAPTTVGDYEGTMTISFGVDDIDPVTISLTGSSTNEVTVADGPTTATNSYIPLYGYYYDNKQINQMIYPESMLNSLKGKKIKSMTFYGNNLGLQGGAYTFKMGITGNTSFSQRARITEGLTTVATVNDGTQTGTELNVVFDEPFVYNGGNLLIDFEETTEGSNYPQNSFTGVYASAASFSSYTNYSSSSLNDDGVYAGGDIQDFLPKVTFSVEDAGTPVVTVDAPVFDPEDGTTFEENLTVILTCATAGATIKYSMNGEYFIDYENPIEIDETSTIYAKAVLGDVESQVVQATYTKEEPVTPPTPSDKRYIKVYNTEGLKSGTYLIVNEEGNLAFDGSLETLDAVGNNIPVTISETRGDKYIQGNDVIDAATFDYDANEKTLKSASGYFIGSTSNANGMNTSETTAYTNTISITEGYDADIVSSGGAYLRYNSASNQNRFRYYKSSSYTGQKAIQLYKLVVDEPAELTVALDPAEKTYTVGEEAKIMVNVENGNDDTMVSYKINDGEDQDYNAETGIVLPNNKAKEYTVTVYATDGEREATATGTYSFTAAPAFDVTLTPNKEGNYTVGDEAVVTVTVDKYIGEEYLVTYTIGDSEEQVEYNAGTGIILPNDKAGDVTVTVYVTDGYDHAEQEYTATYHFDAAPDIVVTLDPAGGNYYLGEEVKVTVTAENTIGDYEVTYKIGDGEELDYEDGITIPSDQEGTVNLTVTVVDGYHDGAATATGAYTFAPRPVVETPTFSLVAGSYTGEQTLNISCATENATILYSTDGGNNWTEGNTVTLTKDCTVMAKATVDGMTESPVATAAYIIDIPAELPTIEPFDGYYKVKNLGNNKYANIAGRKTLNFTNDIDKMAGTVIRIQTDNHGKVLSLRSQAADLQGYADRAMNYVPTFVHLVAEKLDAEGVGELFGETGIDAILEKFNESFDAHLYVEPAEGGFRLYGKTPSMQPVVDFYRDNKAKVEAKLPMLETAINNAIDKILEKTNGSGASILEHFSLHTIWQNMGGTLTEPVDEASTMEFYRQVLNNKNYVWDFAYETAMIYWTNLKNHPKYETDIKHHLGEYADYLEKIENVRPDFKYYIVQDNDKPDFISQGNKDITDNASRTIWSVEPRTEFTVNIPADNKYGDKYVTTLYTDFAYDLPNDVTAFTVTEITEDGKAKINILKGTIPAQTPVLLMAKATEITVTLNTTDGTAPTDNLLVGADYFIKEYNIRTPQVETVFNLVKDLLGETFYNNYVAQYEYLMLKTAGTVNNKYFWGLTDDDLAKATVVGENNEETSVVRTLGNGTDGMGFYKLWSAPANQAFLANDKFNPVKLWLRGDVDRDGDVDISDVTALIDILLGKDTPENNYDYEAADFDLNGTRNIDDVTSLIDFLLGYGYPEDIYSGN